MARLLFEMQAVRTRRGPLATGTEFVVYSDSGGTVLADISATVGGSAIAGSTVTVADIPGLGPSALQFYGPTDGTAVLYLRCPSDASLGVQEIEADEASGGGGDVAVHSADTTAVHGITDTAQVALRNAANTFTSGANRWQVGEPRWDARAYSPIGTAVQQAIDAAEAAGGGHVHAYGTFANTGQVTLKDGVMLQGDGFNQSVLTFPELTAGTAAIVGESDAPFTNSPVIRDLRVLGPGTGSAAVMGTSPGGTATDGISCRSRWLLDNVWIEGFKRGLVIRFDHHVFNRVVSRSNYYNVYFADCFGWSDHVFTGCDLAESRFASVAVAAAGTIDYGQFYGCHVGFGPYGFYKEAGAATKGFLTSTKMYGVHFEDIGNAAILDESTGAGEAPQSLYYCHLVDVGFTWDPAHKIAARAADYAVDVREIVGTEIEDGMQPFLAGSVATYRFTAADFTIRGRTLPTFDPSSNGAVKFDTGAAQGRYLYANAAITSGNLVEGDSYGVRPFGAQGRAFQGVAQATVASGRLVPVATDGLVSVVANEAVATGGVQLVPDETSLARVKAAPSTGASGYGGGSSAAVPNKYPVVGVSQADISAAAAGLMYLTPPGPNRTYVVPGAVTALPTASATYRGQVLRVEGAGGAADVTYQCLKSAADTYSWVTVSTG